MEPLTNRTSQAFADLVFYWFEKAQPLEIGAKMLENGKEEFEEIPGNDPQLDPSETGESAPGLRPRFGWQENNAVVFRDKQGKRISADEWKAMIKEDARNRGEEEPNTPSG